MNGLLPPKNPHAAQVPHRAGHAELEEPRHRTVPALLASLLVIAAIVLAVAPFTDFGAAREALFAGSAPAVRHDPSANLSREVVGERVAELTAAPYVPAAPERTPHNTRVIVHLEVVEKVMRLADGVEYAFWTFGGQVPGSFIRVREGDVVEFHLANHPDNKLPHNIDLHAVTGQGGGAEASLVAPGQEAVFTFRALNSGLYVYHCATAPVPLHIANGMYGLILVDPFEGLPAVDHEFYFMQSEIYTAGGFGEKGLQEFSQEKAVQERPDYVVFNGAVGAAAGDRAPEVKRGESVRLFVGNGGPNLVSSFHVIGEIFDKVYVEGGTQVNTNVQTTLVPAGGSAIVEFTAETPGVLNLVDHSIFRVFNKGALAQIRVIGDENHEVYTGQQELRPYDPAAAPRALAPTTATPAARTPASPAARTFEGRMEHGRTVYSQACMSCHGATGMGLPGVFPPLAGSDYLAARADLGIGIVLRGLQGPITVNGRTYNAAMPAMPLSDDEVASVLTYVNNSWGNKRGEVTPAQVAGAR